MLIYIASLALPFHFGLKQYSDNLLEERLN